MPASPDAPLVVLTGATGFVGRVLLRRLRAGGYRVRALVRDPSRLVPADGVDVIECDLTRPDTDSLLRAAMAEARYVVHGAALNPVSAGAGPVLPVDFVEVNVLGTARLAAALTGNILKAILLSTIDVYGKGQEAPFREDSPPAPVSVYGASKLGGEWCWQTLAHDGGVPWAILRLAQVYGPGEPPVKLIPRTIQNLLEGRPVVIHGSGTQQRQYLFVEDVGEGILCALEKPATGIFNIAGPQRCSVNEIVNLLLELCDAGRVSLQRTGEGVYRHLLLETIRAARELGLVPATDLRTGLACTCAAEKENLVRARHTKGG